MRLKCSGWTGALGAMAFGGLLLRLYAINFGLPGLYDPDEMMFEMGAVRMLTHASLNPGWFGHPATTTMYGLAIINVAVFAVGHLVGWFPTLKSFGLAIYVNPAWMILPGRALMAVFGAGTVWQTGKLGRDLFDRRVGLVAAGLVAISPQCIAWAQVIRSDIMGSFFVLLALRAALRAGDRPGWRRDAIAAAWLGVAIATKWPMGLAGLGMAGMLLRWSRHDGTAPMMLATRSLRFGAMVVGFTLLVSPYLLLAHDTVLRNLRGEAQVHHLGATGGTPWFNLLWYLKGPLADGLGWVGLVLSGGGLLLVCRRTDRRAAWLLVPVVMGLMAVICEQRLVWDRWILPLIPILAMLSGVAVMAVADALALQRRIEVRRGVMALVALAMVVPMGVADMAQAHGRMNDTRQRASAWAIAHVPAGSTVMIEHFAYDLYPQPWRLLFPLGDVGCVDVRALVQGRVGYNVIDSARGQRSNIDYGTMNQAKSSSCRADFAILTQYDRYAAEAHAFPAEYQAYRSLLSRGRIVASFFGEPGRSAGPVVRIVDFRDKPEPYRDDFRN